MTERKIDQDIEHIRQRMLKMGGIVEEMIARSIGALVERDDATADGVIQTDKEVDLLEKEIDERIHTVLVRHQPTAVDHRLLMAVMKITNDLERVGDSASNIARSVKDLNREPPLGKANDLPRLSATVQRLVRDTLDSFVERDVERAYAILKADDEVDELYRRLFSELLDQMVGDPQSVPRALQLLLIGRNLERVADHATNVAENVIYYLQGLDVRHPKAEIPRSD